MPELLLELFSEEIPARMQDEAARALAHGVMSGLNANGLGVGDHDIEFFATPRRLVLIVHNLPELQPDVKEERKGPRVGAPQQAIDGFLKSAGLASLDQCEKQDTGKGEFWIANIEKKGRRTKYVLVDILKTVICGFAWPKSMRWSDYNFRWVRPLHNILALFDGQPIPLLIERKGENKPYDPSTYEQPGAWAEIQAAKSAVLAANDKTCGHRFMAPDPFAVRDVKDYLGRLKSVYVVLDGDERKRIIATQLGNMCEDAGLKLRDDKGLLDEVAGLVEWPVVLMGRIDDKFMDVPPEVLITSMRSHQKYFSLLNADGSLAPRFALVSNMVTEDKGKAIVAGNERVLRARLSDAKFFWDQDRKHSLESRLPKLDQRVFYKGLGTMQDKARRLEKLAEGLAAFVPGCDAGLAARAAKLAKADLSTGMVGEFPELQGVMGRYYAQNDGEQADVAQAVADHYAPQGPSDRCPTAPVSVAVALADKLDTLVGFFAIGEKPTGSKDPFALRRAALGVIRLIIENKLRLPLSAAFMMAGNQYGELLDESGLKAAYADLPGFFADRLKVHLKEQKTRHDLVDAVFALGGEDDLVRLLARVAALQAFLASADGANLLTGYKRAANILKIEEKKDKKGYSEAVLLDRLQEAPERALADALGKAQGLIGESLRAEDFMGAMGVMAGLRQPVDAFFDQVTVNSEEQELRANRLRLLAGIRSAVDQVADFSKIEG
ncbi:MAG: glycine--tRNA ligase subunit beta [Alphaproteobacteria bacterium]|nr:glycine--tRNA ligase subunit beta [Alphaproteobacteria bacterium]